MNRPTLSLLIPAYNAASFLPRLLISAQKQSKSFDQIWVYDDCSTDDTAAVAESLGANVLRGRTNKGCSAGKNALAAAVDTDFMHFHDADDELLPNFVALARRWIERGPPDVVLFAYEYRDDTTGELLTVATFDPEDLARDPRSFAIRHQINPFCGMYRRAAFLAAGGYDEDPEVLYNEDVAFHIRLAFAGLTFGAETEVSIVNWRHGGSMSGANSAKCAKAHLAVLRKTAARPGATDYAGELSAKLWGAAGVLGSHKLWREAEEAARLARGLDRSIPRSAGGRWFRSVARLSPRVALRLRESAIRTLKPSLRS